MKHLLLIPIIALALTACSGKPNTTEVASKNISSDILGQTPGLEGCSLYIFKTEQYAHSLKIVRCPGLSTTSVNQEVTQNKTTAQTTTVVIDGVEYVKKETSNP